MTKKKEIGTAEVAAILECTDRTVRRIEPRLLPYDVRGGNRVRLYTIGDVRRFKKKHWRVAAKSKRAAS